MNVSALLAGSGLEFDHQVSGHPAAIFSSMPCARPTRRTSVVFRPFADLRLLPRAGLRVCRLLGGLQHSRTAPEPSARPRREALARYVNAGRRVGGRARKPARGSSRRSANGLNTTEVREWARAQGIEVKDRGRVPADLVVKFKAATSQ